MNSKTDSYKKVAAITGAGRVKAKSRGRGVVISDTWRGRVSSDSKTEEEE